MNKLHIAAGILFVIAVLMYTVGMEMAIEIGALGIFCEAAAWVMFFSAERKAKDC